MMFHPRVVLSGKPEIDGDHEWSIFLNCLSPFHSKGVIFVMTVRTSVLDIAQVYYGQQGTC